MKYKKYILYRRYLHLLKLLVCLIMAVGKLICYLYVLLAKVFGA